MIDKDKIKKMSDRKMGIIVIGRNEGERLKRCLSSLHGQSAEIVYVDSGSTDDSVLYASSLGLDVVQLDTHIPFNAARARNEGFRYLAKKIPELQYFQFVDGDCELCEGWLLKAVAHLEKHPSCAAVAGKLAEKFPEKSIYNRLNNLEWNSPIGEVDHCGGIFVTRKDAFQSAGGFNAELIAGEEPELCYRLRAEGWKIHRIEESMALHDSAMMKFSQWWKRMIRGGYAATDVVHCLKHVGNLENGIPYARQIQSAKIWTWGWLGVSIFLISAGSMISGAAGGAVGLMAGIGLWLGQCVRTARRPRAMGASWPDALLYGAFAMLAKWPQIVGQRRYFQTMKTKGKCAIIEYK